MNRKTLIGSPYAKDNQSNAMAQPESLIQNVKCKLTKILLIILISILELSIELTKCN